jgi:hypothetical protein
MKQVRFPQISIVAPALFSSSSPSIADLHISGGKPVKKILSLPFVA